MKHVRKFWPAIILLGGGTVAAYLLYRKRKSAAAQALAQGGGVTPRPTGISAPSRPLAGFSQGIRGVHY